tara:strand:- start:760 stop:1422 length:663 start_codon:yes stop_codon:yes gene_type:complete
MLYPRVSTRLAPPGSRVLETATFLPDGPQLDFITLPNDTARGAEQPSSACASSRNGSGGGVVVVLLFGFIAAFLLLRMLPVMWSCGKPRYAASLRDTPSAQLVAAKEATSMKDATNGEEKLVIVMFYADWCVHCKRFKDDFGEIAKSLHGSHAGKVKVAQIEQSQTTGDDLKTMKVEGFPTIVAIFKDANGEVQGSKELNRMEPTKFLEADDHKSLWDAL